MKRSASKRNIAIALAGVLGPLAAFSIAFAVFCFLTHASTAQTVGFALLGVGSIGGGLATYSLFIKSITNPLQLIAEYLSTGDVDTLRDVIRDPSEFGVIASLLEDAAKQKAALEWEMEARRHLAEEMFRAKQVAESHSDYKTQFLANMSHELRTPMNGVIGMTQVLLSTDLSSQQREYTEVIQNSANALLTVVNDILDYSKIEAGKMQVHTESFSLRSLIEEVTDLLAPQAHHKDIELVVDVHPEVPEVVEGDAMRVRQIVTNLLGNAVKFTHEGYIRTEVKVLQTFKKEARVRITIEDTGIGIPEDRREAIFDSFTQADGSTTRRYGGTGLGLTICRRLTAMLGGALDFKSTVNVGSAFFVEIPFGVPQDQRAAPTFDTLRAKKALLVTKCTAQANAIQRLLSPLGLMVTARAGYDEAKRFVVPGRSENYDLILWDADDILDRNEVAKILETQSTTLAVRALLARPEALARLHGAIPGFNAYVTKPIRRERLYQALRHNRPNDKKSDSTKLFNGARVLIADDNDVNRAVLKETLERLGCSAFVVEDGYEAVKLFRESEFDLILLDLNMPTMSGIEATQAIRASGLPKCRTVPIICMTATDEASEVKRCIDAGMNDSIPKPFRPEQLVDVFQRHLEAFHNALQQAVEETMSPSKPVNQVATFDPNSLEHAFGEDAVAMIEVVQTFVKSLPETLRLIDSLNSASRFSELTEKAHALKGMCRTVGCLEFARLAENIEAAAAMQDGERVSLDLAVFSERLNPGLREIRDFLKEKAA